MNKSPRLALATAVLVALAGLSQANAADIVPVITDPAGVGYNDTTPVAPVGGNPGTTRGEQRRIVAPQAPAQLARQLAGIVAASLGERQSQSHFEGSR